MKAEERLKQFTIESYQKNIHKINERIYHFCGYGHSNVTAIIADNSIILIDTLDSGKRSQRLLDELNKITNKPVKTIIYTHGHPDHRGGAGTFKDTVEEIVAYTPIKAVLKYYDRINDVLNKRGQFQHGSTLTNDEAISQGIGIREGYTIHDGIYEFLTPTTLYHNETIDRTIDGVKLKLVSAPGETDDHLYVWLEDDKVMCCGDNYYGCFPALYAIRGTQYRDIATWIETLENILRYPSIALLPGHTKAIIGYDLIQEQVGTFKDAIEFILLETLYCMNKGMTLNQTAQYVRLPDYLKVKPYLQEFYGTVEWAVKSIYNGYVGWFDGNPVELLPIDLEEYNQHLLELIGEDKLIYKIRECMKQEKYQLALQLLELASYPQLKKECLLQRAKQVTSANARHYLIASAKEIE